MHESVLDGIAQDVATRLRTEGAKSRGELMAALKKSGLTEIQVLLALAHGLQKGLLRPVTGTPDRLEAVAVAVDEENGSSQSVLIVEDDLDVQESVGHVLVDEGYRVFAANNGREALDLLPRIPRPSLILLDLMMPVMNGWDFLEALRADGALSRIPVAIVSAMAERAPADARVIRKPIQLTALVETVTELCGGAAPNGADRPAHA